MTPDEPAAPAPRRLVLLRHAKSSWDDPDLDDHARPLNGRGRRAAPVMGAWLRQQGLSPDHVLTSDSARTLETWALTAPAFAQPPESEPQPRLYHADPATMLDALRGVPDAARCVLMIGHQPGISGFARKLCGGDAPAQCARAFRHYPTAAAAVFEIEAARWVDLGWGGARFTAFACPRELV